MYIKKWGDYMREIEVTYHDGSLVVYPRHIFENQVDEYINAWKNNDLLKKAKEENADHFIYLTKTYDDEGNIIELDFYCFGLNNDEFHKRVDSNNKYKAEQGYHVYYGVWHKGTNY